MAKSFNIAVKDIDRQIAEALGRELDADMIPGMVKGDGTVNFSAVLMYSLRMLARQKGVYNPVNGVVKDKDGKPIW